MNVFRLAIVLGFVGVFAAAETVEVEQTRSGIKVKECDAPIAVDPNPEKADPNIVSDSSRLGQIHHALLKAPYHTCTIKRFMDLRDFIEFDAHNYKNLAVRPYSQPPTFYFYSEDGEIVESVKVTQGMTRMEIDQVLRSRGLA